MILPTPLLLHARAQSQHGDQLLLQLLILQIQMPNGLLIQPQQSSIQLSRLLLWSQIMSIKLSKSVLKTPLINLINQLDQRVISTLTGTGSINQVVLNGVLMAHMVLITLETCQLKSLLDLTHQHLLQSLLFFFKHMAIDYKYWCFQKHYRNIMS